MYTSEQRLLCLPLGNPLIWIGATDEETEGQWVWDSTGDVINFNNWAVGDPNNGNRNEHCACMNTDGAWWDVGCGWSAPHVICETL